ncbi:hypothetical protein LIER_41644 [Lithospermum erythrorhizon]|uniref:Uncharacterized protein n=1 Tax=Lithospermum erythrorhizon TaxID=34254 RepID=A0AAV3RGD6_LITER
MTVSQYFSKVKFLSDEILKLDPDNAITERRMKRIIIHGLRPDYKGIATATRGWATEPTLADLENPLMNEEELDRPSSRYVRDEEEALSPTGEIVKAEVKIEDEVLGDHSIKKEAKVGAFK